MRPGVNILTSESPPPLALPTSTGTVYMMAVTEKGPLGPVEAKTPTEWITKLGGRTATSQLAWDAADTLFKEGSKRIITSRVVGPGAVTASVNVMDGSAAVVFTARAAGPGVYGNDRNVVVRTNTQDTNIPVGSFKLRVTNDAGDILEESPTLDDKTGALYWIDTVSTELDYTDGPSANDPAAATYALAGGNDDVAAINDASWAAARDLLPADLGTGILIAPGRTTDAGHDQIATGAEQRNRVWYGDAADTPTVATLLASAAGRRSDFGGLFWPYVRVAGLSPGTYRTVPPSVIVAGISARNDALGISPNKPAAAELGASRTALGLSQTVTDAIHQQLNDGGINVLRNMFGQIRVMGWRTTADPVKRPRWVNLGNARLHRAIANGAWLVGNRFLFREIDGNGLLVAEWQSALIGEVVMPYYLAGSLYGDRPEEAFRVDVSGNTGATAQARQLLADIILVMSEYGEEITVNIAKQLITEGVGA